MKVEFESPVSFRSGKEKTSGMDYTECETITNEMLDKLAELDHSKNYLRELNSKMRSWLDVADEDMAVLRTENNTLKAQVKKLEKMIHDAQQAEAESCRSLLADDLQIKRRNEKKIQTAEQESVILKEENKKLNAEIKNFQLQQKQDKTNLKTLRTSLQTLDSEIAEAHIALQYRNEVIQQKFLELKHAEETVEEYSTIIKDLKTTNQMLREQVEAVQLELSLATVNNLTGLKTGSPNQPLSFADEIKQLASFADVKTLTPEPQHEEAETEELPKPQNLTVDPQIKRCTSELDAVFHNMTQFLLCLFIITLLAFVASGCFTGNAFTDTVWNNAQRMLKPYVRVHYGCLPPI